MTHILIFCLEIIYIKNPTMKKLWKIIMFVNTCRYNFEMKHRRYNFEMKHRVTII